MSADKRTLIGSRVLVIGINYWPEPTGIAPYTTGIAEHLAEHGAAVTVLTGMPHYPSWTIPAHYSRRLIVRDHVRGVEVLRLRHYVPRTMTAFRRAMYEATFLAHVAFRSWRHQPDVIVAISPALASAVAAAAVSRRHHCALVIVVQDLVAQASVQSGITGGRRVSGLVEQLEGGALRSATRVALVSDRFRSAVEAYGISPKRIELLPNWAHVPASLLSRREARSRLGWPASAFLVLHTGNMGLKQDLGNVIAAARVLQGSGVLFYLVGDGNQRRELQLRGKGVDNLKFVDIVPDPLYPTALAAADVLLLNEAASVGDMSLPSKLTSYLTAGRPIIAAVSAAGATYRELLRTDAAIIVAPGDPRALADAISELRAKPSQAAAMAGAARAFARRHLQRDPALFHFVAILNRAVVAASRMERSRPKRRPCSIARSIMCGHRP